MRPDVTAFKPAQWVSQGAAAQHYQGAASTTVSSGMRENAAVLHIGQHAWKRFATEHGRPSVGCNSCPPYRPLAVTSPRCSKCFVTEHIKFSFGHRFIPSHRLLAITSPHYSTLTAEMFT